MTPEPASATATARGRRTLLALAALFFLPVIVAFWLYYASDWRPGGATHHGVLIDPVRPLPEFPGGAVLRGKWTLVYIGDGACDADCRHALHVMRQTRLALNADMSRVQRTFLATGGCCDYDFLQREHPGLIVIDAAEPRLAGLLAAFAPRRGGSAIFIVDPRGNLVMREDAHEDPKHLREDLRRLLRLSHIG